MFEVLIFFFSPSPKSGWKEKSEISLQICDLNIIGEAGPMEWFLFYVDPLFLNDYIFTWISNTRLISNKMEILLFENAETTPIVFF